MNKRLDFISTAMWKYKAGSHFINPTRPEMPFTLTEQIIGLDGDLGYRIRCCGKTNTVTESAIGDVMKMGWEEIKQG